MLGELIQLYVMLQLSEIVGMRWRIALELMVGQRRLDTFSAVYRIFFLAKMEQHARECCRGVSLESKETKCRHCNSFAQWIFKINFELKGTASSCSHNYLKSALFFSLSLLLLGTQPCSDDFISSAWFGEPKGLCTPQLITWKTSAESAFHLYSKISFLNCKTLLWHWHL